MRGRSVESNAFSSSAFILAAVGVLRGSRFNGGSRNGGRFLFPVLAWCRCRGSLSISPKLDDLRDAALGPLGTIPTAFIVSANVLPTGLPEIGVSVAGWPDDLAEKNGCSISLCGDSYAFGMAGTGGTSSLLTFSGSSCGFGVGSLDDDTLAGNGGTLVEFLADPKLVLDDNDWPEL